MAGGGKGTATYHTGMATRAKSSATGEDATHFRMQKAAERAFKNADAKMKGSKLVIETKGGKGNGKDKLTKEHLREAKEVLAARNVLRNKAGSYKAPKGEALRAAAPKGGKASASLTAARKDVVAYNANHTTLPGPKGVKPFLPVKTAAGRKLAEANGFRTK